MLNLGHCYFWQVLESIHKFIIEIHVLQCLIVRGYNKKQRKGRIILNFTKGETFSFQLFYINQMLLGIILQCGAPSCTLAKKAFLSPSIWERREYIWKFNWKKSSLICFENCQGVSCSHRQSRNRMMNTFI